MCVIIFFYVCACVYISLVFAIVNYFPSSLALLRCNVPISPYYVNNDDDDDDDSHPNYMCITSFLSLSLLFFYFCFCFSLSYYAHWLFLLIFLCRPLRVFWYLHLVVFSFKWKLCFYPCLPLNLMRWQVWPHEPLISVWRAAMAHNLSLEWLTKSTMELLLTSSALCPSA